MKTSFLLAGSIILLLSVVLGSLLVFSIVALARRQYFSKTQPNHAQSTFLSGQIAAGLILLTAVFGPVKDFLTISSVRNPFQDPALWCYVLICCSGTGIGFVVVISLTKLLAGLNFKGTTIALAMEENDWGYALILAVIQVGLSLVIVQGLVLLLQAFLPIPNIPTIR